MVDTRCLGGGGVQGRQRVLSFWGVTSRVDTRCCCFRIWGSGSIGVLRLDPAPGERRMGQNNAGQLDASSILCKKKSQLISAI